ESVPVMDISGVVALDSAIRRLHADGICVVLAGVRGQPAKVLARAGIEEVPGRLLIEGKVSTAIWRVRRLLGLEDTASVALTEL
ncbi:MAG TPA: sodium-independent anion transporter, partial [Plasticicumulans sp.]|nr:sodium-independent anion transporter [Plasticicumulans sp.]